MANFQLLLLLSELSSLMSDSKSAAGRVLSSLSLSATSKLQKRSMELTEIATLASASSFTLLALVFSGGPSLP